MPRPGLLCAWSAVPSGAEQEEGETLHHVDEEVLCVVLLGQPTGARRSSHPQKPVAGEKEQSCLISDLAFASLAPWRNPSMSKKVRRRIPEGATADSTSLISSKGGKATVKASERRPEASAWCEEDVRARARWLTAAEGGGGILYCTRVGENGQT